LKVSEPQITQFGNQKEVVMDSLHCRDLTEAGATPEGGACMKSDAHEGRRRPRRGTKENMIVNHCFILVFAAVRQKPVIVPSSYLFSLKVNLLNVSFYSVSVSRSLQTSLRLKIVRFSGVF